MPSKKLYLVAVDGSEWGERAAQRAIMLAKDTGAEVMLATVIPWSGYQPMSVEELSNRPLVKEAEEAHAQKSIIDPITEKYGDGAVEINACHEWGTPVDVIRDMAKKLHANMVFVGRRGRSRVADLILGSVANGLAHRLGVPIVLVP